MTVRSLALAVALSLASAGSALAVDLGPFKSELKKQCTNDYLKFCGNLDPDGPEVAACFKQNRAQVNPGCNSAISNFQKAQKARG